MKDKEVLCHSTALDIAELTTVSGHREKNDKERGEFLPFQSKLRLCHFTSCFLYLFLCLSFLVETCFTSPFLFFSLNRFACKANAAILNEIVPLHVDTYKENLLHCLLVPLLLSSASVHTTSDHFTSSCIHCTPCTWLKCQK